MPRDSLSHHGHSHAHGRDGCFRVRAQAGDGHERRHGGKGRGEHSGRGGRGGFGRGGGRIFGPGDLRLILLALVADKPRHGYELIRELEQKFDGSYAPSPGSVYPTLTLLEELGYIRSAASESNRRLFEITDEGHGYLRENDAALKSALARLDMAARAVAGEAPPEALHHAMHTLKGALLFHRGGWDEAETLRVQKIIEDAAAAIGRRNENE